MNTLEFLSQDKQLRMEYEARQKFLHDQASMMNAAKNAEAYGFKIGMQEGVQKGIEDTARRLIKMGLSLDEVAEATGLTTAQIENL